MLGSRHAALADMDWARDCLRPCVDHPRIGMGGWRTLHGTGAFVRPLFGRQTPHHPLERAVFRNVATDSRTAIAAKLEAAMLSSCGDSRRALMANKEQRSNREKRKPKKEKPKPAPVTSTVGRKS